MKAKAALLALRLIAPGFPEREAAARHVAELSAAGGFRAGTLLEYVRHESGWNPSATNNSVVAGEVIGLGQLRLLNYRACQKDLSSAACADVRESLFDWRHNLDETARTFVAWRGLCRRLVGTSAARFWLQGVTGWDAKRHTTCGFRNGRSLPVPKPVLELLRRGAALEARF